MTKKRSNSVTIKDIAQEARVSYSTVSRVLNNYEHVRQDKRERVWEAVTRLGYVVNQQARSLAGGRSHVIGFLVHELGNGYIGEICQGIDEELAEAQYDLMLYTTHRRKTRESTFVSTLARGMTDGLLLSLPLNPHAYLESLRKEQYPYVVIDHQGFDDVSPTVVAKNWQAAYGATSYLIELGHRRIGFITGLRELSSATERLNGYKAALEKHGIPFAEALVRDGGFYQITGFQAAHALLSMEDRPTAIFASNDLSAFGAIDAAREHGLAIPEDVSILGFDDIPQAASVRPALTTVRQPLREMGRAATRLLLEYIEDPTRPRERIEFNTELVIRQSCASPRG